MDQWPGGRDSELTCVCSRTGVSNGPGDSYPAAERRANVLCEANRYRSVSYNECEQRATTSSDSCRLGINRATSFARSPDPIHICECISSLCILRAAIVFVSEGSERVKTATLSFNLNNLSWLQPSIDHPTYLSHSQRKYSVKHWSRLLQSLI